MATTSPGEATPSAKQLVFLAMVAAVVAVIVFLCGVLVGRGVPVRPATGVGATEGVPRGVGARGDEMPEFATTPDDPGGSPLDELSYFNRLNGTEPVPETLVAPTLSPSGLQPASAAGAVGRSAPAATFVVQVTALRRADEAQAIAAGLVARGYPAFVLDPTPGAPVAVHRVRVGPYADRREAEAVGHRLEAEEQFKPWVIQS